MTNPASQIRNRKFQIGRAAIIRSRDPDRVNRFQREAEVLASLNHPNIAAIYDLVEAYGSGFLVLELVQGETLADRIRRGPVPIDEALNIAKHICEALEAAHENGVVHRDLKPSNVKITPEGKVKVLDFGLAKATEMSSAKPDFSNSPTLMSGSTPGMIMGTAAYMSPEQARGKTVDKRADIWALGCVLYELLTGTQAFRGEDVQETLAAVLKAEPDWTLLPATTPQSVRVLLRRCLQKDVNKRFRDAADGLATFWRHDDDLFPGRQFELKFGIVATRPEKLFRRKADRFGVENDLEVGA